MKGGLSEGCRAVADGPLLGTSDIARLAGVSRRTAATWIDRGLLRGFRLPPTMKFRRARKDDLAKFLADNGMPVPEELRHYMEER